MGTGDIFLQSVSVAISCIAILVSLILLALFVRYLRLKQSDPYSFTLHHVLGPPSIHLLYYLMISTQFITFSQYYIYLCQFISYTVWENYCDRYNDDVSRCDLDEHCAFRDLKNGHDTSCNVGPLGVVYVILLEGFAFFFLFWIHFGFYCCFRESDYNHIAGHNCVQWIRYKSKLNAEWKDDYYRHKYFQTVFLLPGSRIICDFWWFCNFILFYPMPLMFCFMFNGPNINYVEWHTFLALMILSVPNEVIKHYIYKSHHQYKENEVILCLLTNEFGKDISNLIWTVYANENRPIRELEGNIINIERACHRDHELKNKRLEENAVRELVDLYRNLPLFVQDEEESRYIAEEAPCKPQLPYRTSSGYIKDQRTQIMRHKQHSLPTPFTSETSVASQTRSASSQQRPPTIRSALLNNV